MLHGTCRAPFGRSGGTTAPPGVDGQTVEQFDGASPKPNWLACAKNCKTNATAAKRRAAIWIPKPGSTEKRPLEFPRSAIAPSKRPCATFWNLSSRTILRKAATDFGLDVDVGEAVERVEELLGQGYVWCVDCDLKSYFDTIPHTGLMALVKSRVVDGSVLALIEQGLRAGVLEELQGWQPTERGTHKGP